tara:strand:+ start:4540 stop:4980 length:441 start_codon:yes stop_codon:yes gene_type:complete
MVLALATNCVISFSAAAPEPESGVEPSCPLSANSEVQLRKSIELSRVVRMDRSLPGVLSPNGAYQFWLMSPSPHQGPLALSTIDIDSERSDLQRISIPGVSGAIDVRWVSEKLIFAAWHWHQNISAGMLHDVERGTVLSLTFACDQ